MFKVGDKIKVWLNGEPNYQGKVGVITSIDSMGQLHGTWGGLAAKEDYGDKIVRVD